MDTEFVLTAMLVAVVPLALLWIVILALVDGAYDRHQDAHPIHRAQFLAEKEAFLARTEARRHLPWWRR